MKRESIVKLFEHIAAWEISHGVQDAFQFKNILSSRKQGALLPSRYSGENGTTALEHDNTIPAPAPRRKSKSWREAAGNVNDHGASHLPPDRYPVDSVDSFPGTQSTTRQQQALYESMPTMPALSLDQAFSVDPPIDLDRELDPAIHFGTISAGMVAAPVATSAHGHSGGDPELVDNRVPAAE